MWPFLRDIDGKRVFAPLRSIMVFHLRWKDKLLTSIDTTHSDLAHKVPPHLYPTPKWMDAHHHYDPYTDTRTHEPILGPGLLGKPVVLNYPLVMEKKGTMDDPIIVDTIMGIRTVGCTGYPKYSHEQVYFRMKAGETTRCPDCCQAFHLRYIVDPDDISRDSERFWKTHVDPNAVFPEKSHGHEDHGHHGGNTAHQH
ncbi:COX5B-domain-containing protein [Rozella allomycis CSF55]|uniref:COX5B-domain-containing protein n=1 Tax=Rozella allomycis (strain CSF55) TaxID=988480 RepID=A0A4P9YKB9_ROZAC|nr:COX5B-domain-containing protein [Rozella allomycis CSF55]